MYVLFSVFDNKAVVVAWDYDPDWDMETQTMMEIDEIENANTTVNTPNGPTPLTGTRFRPGALFTRTEAFSLVNGQLQHDPAYLNPEA